MTGRPFPFAAIAVAIVACGALMLAGADTLLVLAALLVWIASFWLVAATGPTIASVPAEGVRLSIQGMRDLIERSGLPMFVLDEGRVIVANATARELVGGHVVGQDARVAFRHPEAVALLAHDKGGSATILGLTDPHSQWHMTIQPFGERYRLVELLNRTAEIDISRAHTDFVANASHELRTPLASIIGYIETLIDEDEKADPERAKRFLGTVLREARRLQELVDDLMSLSRVEAEKHDQPRERVDLVALAGQAARDSAGAERVERLRVGDPGETVAVRGDRNQLEQLVRNLVDNALKYGAPEDEVELGIGRDERNMAVLTVTDRGEGIAAEHIPHLTRRFYRIDPGRSRAAGGTGLGLAIVKHIVERHRGRLDIASRVGEGTTVTVRLPLDD